MANAEGKVVPSTNTCKGDEDSTVPRCHGSEAWLRTRTRSPVTNGVLSTMPEVFVKVTVVDMDSSLVVDVDVAMNGVALVDIVVRVRSSAAANTMPPPKSSKPMRIIAFPSVTFCDGGPAVKKLELK
jgi:hypothetical protein